MLTCRERFEEFSPFVERVLAAYAAFTEFVYGPGAVSEFNVKRTEVKNLRHGTAELRDTLMYVRGLSGYNWIEALGLPVKNDTLQFNYRTKYERSLQRKIAWYGRRDQGFAVKKGINDLLGARLIVHGLRECEQEWAEHFKNDLGSLVSRVYIRDDDTYHALHVYIEDNNRHFPWEIQLWDFNDAETNYAAHDRHEQRKDE